MIALTSTAADAMKSALSRAPDATAGLRIMVEAGGCAGFKYMMGIETSPRDGDEIVESEGVRLYIDEQSRPLLDGMTVDFVTSIEQTGFVFDNPNAQSKCACGKSFS